MKVTRPPTIEVRNLQRKIAVNVTDLRKFAEQAIGCCLHLPANAKTDFETLPEVSVLIVSDRRMASLHRRFMNKSGPTDVITFQHGEIFISADTAARNARRFGNALNQEFRLYVIHSLLHLFGTGFVLGVRISKVHSREYPEGERAREPNQAFPPGEGGEIARHLRERVHRHCHAQVEVARLPFCHFLLHLARLMCQHGRRTCAAKVNGAFVPPCSNHPTSIPSLASSPSMEL